MYEVETDEIETAQRRKVRKLFKQPSRVSERESLTKIPEERFVLFIMLLRK